MSARPRYILHPGWVRSINDRDAHYVGVGRLRELYRIPPFARAIIVDSDHTHGFGYREEPGDIHCRPRMDGKYPVFER